MKRLYPQSLVYEKFYLHEIVALNLSKIYFLKKAEKTCQLNNRNLNSGWISNRFISNWLSERNLLSNF